MIEIFRHDGSPVICIQEVNSFWSSQLNQLFDGWRVVMDTGIGLATAVRKAACDQLRIESMRVFPGAAHDGNKHAGWRKAILTQFVHDGERYTVTNFNTADWPDLDNKFHAETDAAAEQFKIEALQSVLVQSSTAHDSPAQPPGSGVLIVTGTPNLTTQAVAEAMRRANAQSSQKFAGSDRGSKS